MNKKTLAIAILSIFILISSASFVGFAKAQSYNIPDPTCVDVPGIPCPGKSAAAPLNSPSKACQFYQNRWEKGLILVVKNTENECLVRVGDNNTGFGYIHGYYSGNKFCLDSYGAYFNNAGLSDSSECMSVSQTNKKQQPPSDIEKIINQISKYILEFINYITNIIKGILR